jgi:mycothiol synthase
VTTFRRYRSLSDLAAMESIISGAWLSDARPMVPMTVGDLEWWMCQGGPGADWATRIQIWSEGDQTIAWGWFNPPGSVEVFVAPGLPADHDLAIRDEILEWAVERVRAEDTPAEGIQIWAADGSRDEGFLLDRGFVATEEALTQFFRDFEDELAPPLVPPGYRVRTVDGPDEIGARVEVHRAAFAPSKMTEEKYELLIGLPHYSFDQDVVVSAPDGSLAAFTMCWLDPAGAVGEFEPVGTHPDHRGLGLAKAANLFGLRLLQALGAQATVVFSDCSNVASQALYRSVGFRELCVHRRYIRRLDR